MDQGETAGKGSGDSGSEVFAHALRWKLTGMDRRRVVEQAHGQQSAGVKVKCWSKESGQWRTGVVCGLAVAEGGAGGQAMTVRVELDQGAGRVDVALPDDTGRRGSSYPCHVAPAVACVEWRWGLVDRLRQATHQKVEAEKKGGGRTQRKQWNW
mmetsp:Transcript_22632/g.44827  ORF Transcript_22632/g.44827 Transcript_22632/m.44827 type:complete len:154 (-) Transcript_22632:202-663(-)